MNVSKFKVWTL